MNAQTGRWITGIEHLKQAIVIILTTLITSRVMRRDVGSRTQSLVDEPTNPQTLVDIVADSADSIEKWEPRFRVVRVHVIGVNEKGKVELDLEGIYAPTGKALTLQGLIV